MKTSEVLDRAADLIEERGWIQGEGWPGDRDNRPDNAPLCLEGGIMAALGLEYPDRAKFLGCPAHAAVREYLNLLPERALFTWNDRAAKSKEEVIAVLRAASAVEAAKEAELAEV